MDKQLTLSLKIKPTCGVYLEDTSKYSSLDNITKYYLVEYLEKDEVIINQRITPITSVEMKQLTVSDEFSCSDGKLSMARLVIPSIDLYLEDGEYKVEEKYFVYKNEVYLSHYNVINPSPEAFRLVEDYSSLLNVEQDNIYSGVVAGFSYCALKNCVLELLKEEIQKIKCGGCDFTCSQENAELNFLLESVYALEMLVAQSRFAEAQRILNVVSGCGNLCGSNTNTKTNCNCGRS